MRMSSRPTLGLLASCFVLLGSGPALAQLALVSHSPTLNATAATTSTVVLEFDRALDPGSVNFDNIRVYGRWSGPVRGQLNLSNGNQTLTIVPDSAFSAGETVFVNLSHDLEAADTTALRSEGYAFQFLTATQPSTAEFRQIDSFSNKTGAQTRIYGASAADLNGDDYLDLATINEVSADVRVFLNRADGSGLFQPMLPRVPIGVEASPSEPADFDNDGSIDLVVGAAISDQVNILIGSGDGGFSEVQDHGINDEPHGVAALDADGDGDLDVVSANVGSNNLSLLVNDGTGTFAAPVYFEGGVEGEYGLVASDMNADGITDLVVAGRNGSEVATVLGNGDGTFTPLAAEFTGGPTWVVVLGDVDGDGDLDTANANDGSGTVGVLKNNGDGTFAAATILNIGSHVPSVDLGDLDGDGDVDMVVSSYGGEFWRHYSNDGTGVFTFVEDIAAPNNPSCSVLYDSDNDGDLDMALFDEIADVVILMENSPETICPPSPSLDCRLPLSEGRSKLGLKNQGGESQGLRWSWTQGAATTMAEFGDPLVSDDYELCVYEGGALAASMRVPAGQNCPSKPCWTDKGDAWSYKDKEGTPDGISSASLAEGLEAGDTKLGVKGKGGTLDLPALGDLTGVMDVQLHNTSGAVCWGATFSPPFKKADSTKLLAVSDAPPTTTTTTSTTSTTMLTASWASIHASVIGPTCGGCHGGSGGLSGLAACNSAWSALVNVAAVRLPTMDRVEPSDPATSFLMHKLDGTHTTFNASCTGGSCGSQMPIGSPLPPATRDLIRDWITAGAVNDCP